MKLSKAGMDLIRRSEGFRSSIYTDVAGFQTIGYGHKVRPGEVFPAAIDEAEATALLTTDVGNAEKTVARLVRVEVTQGQFDALVDFCFNLGSGHLAASTLLYELNVGHYADAAVQLLAWDHAAGKVNEGLKARREAEYRLWTQADTITTVA